MPLIRNPHDDLSLRRVTNTPARGIGKGIMGTVEQVAPESNAGLPLLAAGLQRASAELGVRAHRQWSRGSRLSGSSHGLAGGISRPLL